MLQLQLFGLLNLEFFYTTCSWALASQDELKVKWLHCRAGKAAEVPWAQSPAAPSSPPWQKDSPGADAALQGPGCTMDPAGHSCIKTTPP